MIAECDHLFTVQGFPSEDTWLQDLGPQGLRGRLVTGLSAGCGDDPCPALIPVNRYVLYLLQKCHLEH